MHNLLKSVLATSVLGIALVAPGATIAVAVGAPPEPCAQQEQQVVRAQEALARVTAVFAKKQQKVEDAEDAVAEADTDTEETAARQQLRHARAEKAKVAKTKRAQQVRLTKAQERLSACQADQAPEPEPVPVPEPEPKG